MSSLNPRHDAAIAQWAETVGDSYRLWLERQPIKPRIPWSVAANDDLRADNDNSTMENAA